MGNLDSRAKFEHGKILLSYDQPYFVAGSELTGKVYLELDQPYPATSLNIELKGKEEIYWRKGKHDNPHNDPESEYIKHNIKNYKGIYKHGLHNYLAT